MRTTGISGLLLIGLLTGACSGQDNEPAPVIAESDVTSQRLATYRGTVEFDAEGIPTLSVELVRLYPLSDGALTPGQKVQVEQSVLDSVSVSAPGTWNPTTETLTADMRITTSGTLDLDEPKLQITRICESVGTKCTSCMAAEITAGTCTVDVNAAPGVSFEGVHVGSGRVGSHYAFADLEVGGGAVSGSAHQAFAAKSVGGVSFGFEIDVLADPVGTPIDSDGDDDTYNAEAGEDAGDDCCDSDPLVYPGATGYSSTPSACGTYDRNCDGSMTPENANLANCAFVEGVCTVTPGWDRNPVPACGQSAWYINDCELKAHGTQCKKNNATRTWVTQSCL